MSWRNTARKSPHWKESAKPSTVVSPKAIKEDILRLVTPEIEQLTSWKNTTTAKPQNGKDGANGRDGRNGKDGKNGRDGLNGRDGCNGRDGKDGINGVNGSNGSSIMFLAYEPTDEGNDGDVAIIEDSFDIYHKQAGEWIKKGCLMGRSAKSNNYVAGLNGLSAYDLAVGQGYVGTLEQWLESLGAAQVDYAQRIDEASASLTYVGKADPGSLDSGALWQIKKIEVIGDETIITWADGNTNFDNIWDNRASLIYS